MSSASQGWSTLSDFVNVETLVGVAVAGVVTHVAHRIPPPCDSDLEWCKKELEDIKTRISELSPDRRERMRIAAERKKCPSLETLTSQLQRLLDERCGLAKRVVEAKFFERYLPAALSQLREDIGVFKGAILDLRSDTWNTTTIHLKEDGRLRLTRVNHRSMTADTNTRARAQPEAHPLDIRLPERAHVKGESIVSQVPIGIA